MAGCSDQATTASLSSASTEEAEDALRIAPSQMHPAEDETLCVGSLASDSPADGSLALYACDAADGALFSFAKRTLMDANKMCVSGDRSEQSVRLVACSKNDSSQAWSIKNDRVILKNTNKCLSVSKTVAGEPVKLTSCYEDTDQLRWSFSAGPGKPATPTAPATPAPGTTTGSSPAPGTTPDGSGTSPSSGGSTGSPTNGGTPPGGTAASWWAPKPSDSWLWDLDLSSVPSPTVSRGPSVANYSADVYDIDPTLLGSQGIATLHKNGKKVVCYVDVGSWEPGRADAASFDSNCICGRNIPLKDDGTCPGNSHKMNGWDEWWFDLHDASCRANVVAGMLKRFQNAANLGCDAIEPDNLDAWQNADASGVKSAGWGITMADQNAYLTQLAKNAHSLGMGILLKNAGSLLVDDNGDNTPYTDAIVSAFDGSLNEQCHQYSECGTYAKFGAAGKVMWNAEYINSSSTSSCNNTTFKSAYCGTKGMKTLQYSCLGVQYTHLAYVCP
jgi:hypothetical protein